MADEDRLEPVVSRPLTEASTVELLKDLLDQSKELVKTEIALARTELKADVKREIGMAKGLGIALVCALSVLNLLLVAFVFALAGTAMSGFVAALVVAAGVAVVGAIAGAIGWSRRVRKPLERTQKTVKEDLRWAKERLT